MKLEVGMYIRTKDGIIDKVIIDYNGHCANPNCKHKHISCAKNYYDEDNVVKASYSIIDILEKGDYVNGSKVVNINYDLNYDEDIVESITIFDYSIEGNDILHNEDIKSIITKKQFEDMECWWA